MELKDTNLVLKYWRKKILNRAHVLKLQDDENTLPNVTIAAKELNYLNKLTGKNLTAKYTIISAICTFLLKRVLEDFDGHVVSNYKDHTNSLLLSFPTDLKTSFKEYLQKSKYEILEVLRNSDYNSKLIAEKTGIDDFGILSNYRINFNSTHNSKADCNGILFNIEINDNEDIGIQISYIECFVSKTIAEYLVRHLSQFVINLKNNILSDLSEYSLLSEQERHQLLVDFNDSTVAYPRDKTIIDLFEEQVLKTPNNIAIVFEGTELTYQELHEKSNQLSYYLQELGVGVDSKVILCFDSLIDLQIVGLLGIIKSGAIYIPIEPDFPQERIQHILEDTNAEFIITSTNYSDIFNPINKNVLVLDEFSFNGKSVGKRNKISQNNICNIIHTSGSTGRPKGVLVSHGNIMDYLFGLSAKINIEDNSSFAMMSTISTDLGSTVLFSALIFGKTIHLFSKDSLRDIYYIRQYFADNKIDCIKIVPTYWAALNENDKMPIPERMIIFGGEKLTNELVSAIIKREADVILINHYGPTETTIGKFLYVLDGVQKGKDIPIGKVFSNTKSYVLDKHMELCPIGVKGELYIGGDGVAKGYLNNLTLTEEKFIENCIVREQGKLYKTGDLVVMLPDGNIEFKGRVDSQVKILGHRIELNEIERVINEFPMIKTSVVIVKNNDESHKELIAYIVTEKTIDKQLLRQYLQRKLPVYMIPVFYVELENLPLTLTGKIDRKSLPSVTGDYLMGNEYVAPGNETEEKLVVIWKDVLGIEKIGITDNFFELGGHSLSVAQLINRIHKQFGKTITFKTFFANPTIAGSSERLQENIYISIPKAPEAKSYPLTASQSRLWILSQLEGGSLAYNIQATVKLKGTIDTNKFEESFKLLIHRHEILRTSIKTDTAGDIRQYIVPEEQINFKISREDYSLVRNQKEAIISYVEEKNKEAFDLEQAPLLRASLIKLQEEEYVFFCSLHHIIGDGWSMELLIAEVVKAYNALVQGKEINLPELSIQYKDYAVWLNGEFQQAKQQASEQYWMQQFEGELPVLDLPSFKTRPLVQTYTGDSIVHHFPKAFLEQLKSFSKEQDVTLFMTLMAGINILLHKYTGQDDLIIGTPIAGREHPDLEKQIGLHLNTLAIRTRIKAGDSFLDLLAAQKETLLGAYEHQSYTFDALIGKLNLKWDTSRSALFDVLVVLQSQGQLIGLKDEELINLQVSNYNFHSKTSKFDISFVFVETEGLDLTIEYNTDIYDTYLIERIFTHLENLLVQSLKQPEILIEEVDYLTEEEKHQLLVEFNNTNIAYPKDKTIVDLFEKQVLRTPNNIAIVFGETELTYQELNEKANQLANYLRAHYSIEPDDLIGIKLDRSERMIVAILGILKSGAAYVPIDMNYPEERKAYIEKDSNSKLVLDEASLERFEEVQGQYSMVNLEKINTINDLAYVIYTSGTTGNPKGVMVENRNAVELINWSRFEFDSLKFEVLYATTSYCFDLSIYEIFYTLSIGKKIRILKNALEINNYINEEDKIILNTVPSVVRRLLEDNIDLKNIALINMAGEVVPTDFVKKLQTEKIEVRNLYGPSEDTTYSTSYVIQNQEYRSIPIGKPISNTQVYILDELLRVLPIGVTGKLYISGAGVARGYLNKPELTAEKFIVNPFIEGSRMYDTGDLGRWLPDGNIEYLGRKDHQVKIRGFRIELGEIESVISQYSEDLQQVVVDAKEVNDEHALVAYFTSGVKTDKSELRHFLEGKLPDYMIPNFYVELEKIPLTPNGKINRKALPNVGGEDLIRKEYIAPRNDIENRLVAIWQEVLGIEKIGITDNFFELGGYSLSAMVIVKKIIKEFDMELSIRDLFFKKDIKEIADIISEKEWLNTDVDFKNEIVL